MRTLWLCVLCSVVATPAAFADSCTGAETQLKTIANDLGIEECFVGFLPKPTLIIDDQAIQDWRGCKHERPI